MNGNSTGLASGSAWMMAARIIERMIGLISTAILARILVPADFGLVAMAMAVVAMTELIGAFGFDWALVRQPSLTPQHLDTAWTLRVAVAVLSGGVLFLFADSAASYYSDDRIANILRFLAVALLVSAAENPGAAMFRREFAFDKEFHLRAGSKVVGSFAGVVFSWLLESYWGLLLGMAAGRLASTVLSYVMHPHRPRPTLSKQRELFSFSIWVFVNSIFSFLRTRFTDFAIGRMVDARAVGLYSTAFELSHLGHTEVAAPINRVAFSSYSRLTDDIGKLRESYLSAIGGIWLVALPIATGAVLVAPQIIVLLLGQSWVDAVPVMRMLGLGAMIALSFENASYVFMALGKPYLTFSMNFLAVVTFVPLLLVWLPKWGAWGAAAAYVVSCSSVAIINSFLLGYQLKLKVIEIIRVSWRVVTSAAVMAAALWLLAPATTPTTSAMAAAQFALLVPVGATVYVGMILTLWLATGRPVGIESSMLARLPAGLPLIDRLRS